MPERELQLAYHFHARQREEQLSTAIEDCCLALDCIIAKMPPWNHHVIRLQSMSLFSDTMRIRVPGV